MKKVKYFIFTLIWPIILFPLILTLLIPSLTNLESKSAFNVLFVLIFYILIGVCLGVMYSAKSKRKPESIPARYIPVLFPIVYAGVLAFAAYSIAGDNVNHFMWGLFLWSNPFFLVVEIAIMFIKYNAIFLLTAVELTGYLGFAIGFFIYEIVFKKQLSIKFSKSISLVLILLTMIPFILSYSVWHQSYLAKQMTNSLSELDKEKLSQISPFKKGNGLAELEKPASLQFTDLQTMPRLDGATAAYPVYAAFVQSVYKGLGEYYKGQPQLDANFVSNTFVSSNNYPDNIVKCSKTSDAYENLINKKCDIIFVAEPSKAQLDEVAAKGDSFQMTKIASEAFVFFNNIKNPVKSLLIEQIQGIYTGKITNWRRLGGTDADILPFQRPWDSGSQTIMENRVMKNLKMMDPIREAMVITMGEMVDNVSAYENSKNAIGYSFLYYTSAMVKSKQIKYISVNGVAPSKETIIDRSYPFTIPVYAVTLSSNKKENVKKLLEWVISDEGQELIAKTGYIGIK